MICLLPIHEFQFFAEIDFNILDFSEEEARMEELAIMGGFADTKFLSRTLSSQLDRLRTRSEIYSSSFFLFSSLDPHCILCYVSLQAWSDLNMRML